MMRIRRECNRRGITRLCHFTQSRNLAHILGDCVGILSRRRLESNDLPYNPTDPDRWDGCEHLVCCSIEYPNVYYFAKVREQDHLFKDWVVLLIKPDFLWTPGTKFCPCNAATARGHTLVRAMMHSCHSLPRRFQELDSLALKGICHACQQTSKRKCSFQIRFPLMPS